QERHGPSSISGFCRAGPPFCAERRSLYEESGSVLNLATRKASMPAGLRTRVSKPHGPRAAVLRRNKMQDDVVIVGAARTPVGAFNGAFANLPAHELGKVAIAAALERAKVAPEEISETIMGQILTAGQGQNPARQASIAAGIPVESPAWGVNQLCGSGL